MLRHHKKKNIFFTLQIKKHSILLIFVEFLALNKSARSSSQREASARFIKQPMLFTIFWYFSGEEYISNTQNIKGNRFFFNNCMYLYSVLAMII